MKKGTEKKHYFKNGDLVLIGDEFEYRVYPEDKPSYIQRHRVEYWNEIHDLGAVVLNGDWQGIKVHPIWENINKIGI